MGLTGIGIGDRGRRDVEKRRGDVVSGNVRELGLDHWAVSPGQTCNALNIFSPSGVSLALILPLTCVSEIRTLSAGNRWNFKCFP